MVRPALACARWVVEECKVSFSPVHYHRSIGTSGRDRRLCLWRASGGPKSGQQADVRSRARTILKQLILMIYCIFRPHPARVQRGEMRHSTLPGRATWKSHAQRTAGFAIRVGEIATNRPCLSGAGARNTQTHGTSAGRSLARSVPLTHGTTNRAARRK